MKIIKIIYSLILETVNLSNNRLLYEPFSNMHCRAKSYVCVNFCLFVIMCPCVHAYFTYLQFLMQVNEQLRDVLAQEQRVKDIAEPRTVQKVRRCSIVFIYLRFDLFIESL